MKISRFVFVALVCVLAGADESPSYATQVPQTMAYLKSPKK